MAETRSLQDIKVAALEKAKAAFGGNTGLARAMATCVDPPTPQAISQWKQVPVSRVPDVESLTSVPRQLLRPDIYGLPTPDLIDALFTDTTTTTEG